MSALEEQIGGNHYKNMPIQVVEFCHRNQIPYMEGNVIKYMCRWREKNGLEDLKKAKHYIELIIELEKKYGTNTSKLSQPRKQEFNEFKDRGFPSL